MHELSIAQAVLDVVLRHAAGRRVTRVDLQVGHLRQIVPSSLIFSFELIATSTSAEGAELVLESIPAVGSCRACGAESVLHEFPLQCSSCGGLDLTIVAGEELIVESLSLEEPESAVYSG